MTFADILYVAVAGLYLLAVLLYLLGMMTRSESTKTVALFAATAGFALHSADLVMTTIENGKTVLLSGQFHTSFLAWTLMALHFFLWWRMKITFLSVAALPLAFLLFAASLSMSTILVTVPKQFTGLFFGLHIGSLTLTLALLAMAFAAGMSWLYLNKRIKTKAGLSKIEKGLPSLSIFDNLNHWAVLVGFPLYTLGLFSSVIWYGLDPEKAFTFDAMKFTALGVWGLFAVAFHQRVILGWKGRKPALMAIWVFALMVVSLIHHTITFKP